MNNRNLDIKLASIHNFGKDKDSDKKGSTGGIGSGSNKSSNAQIPAFSNNMTPPSDEALDMLINYNELAEKKVFSRALYRDAQIIQTVSTLNTKKHPNALITGDTGVGKTQIVEEIANRLVEKDPVVHTMLKGHTIYELPLGKIVSGASYVGQLEEKLYGVIDFASDPKNKVILFIDEIHQIMASSNTSPSYSKIAEILKPHLGRENLHVIGATTTQEGADIMNNPALSRRFYEVKVPELTADETLGILQNIKADFEKHHGVIAPDNILESVVRISDDYKKQDNHRPDTAITLLDKAMCDSRIKRIELIEKAKVVPQLQHVLKAKPKEIVTVDQLEKSALTLLVGNDNVFKENIKELENTLNNKIIGQKTAKEEIVKAMKRLSLKLTKKKRPTSFLFAGPSGTGKTEIAKQLTESTFGSKDDLIYINMSEFSNPASLTRIIGSSAGYVGSESKRELPFDKLENNPYKVILLDEFEKAHTDVQRFFMQALDEGVVKTNRNKIIDFTKSIIIATTNAGVVEFSKNAVGFNRTNEESSVKSRNDVTKALKQSFDTELLNRFEKIIAFTAVSKNDYTKILAVKYNEIVKEVIKNRKDLSIEPKNIDIEKALNNDKLKELANRSYTPVANGRPAEKTIREYIEDEIIENPNNTKFQLI